MTTGEQDNSQSDAVLASGPRQPGAVRVRMRLLLLPLLLFAILMVMTLLLWRQESSEQETMLRSYIKGEQLHVARRLESSIRDQLDPVIRLGADWRNGRLQSQRQFLAAAGAVAGENGNIVVIGWVGSNGVCRVVTPLPGNEMLVGARLSDLPQWREAYAQALRDRSVPAGIVRAHPVHKAVLSVVLPVGAEEDDAFDGAVIAQLPLHDMIELVLEADAAKLHALELRDRSQLIYVAARDGAIPLTDSDALDVLGDRWHLRLMPTEQFVAAWSAREPWAVLAGGTAISLLVSGLALQALYHRWRDAELTRKHLVALEALNQIATAASSQPAARKELLDRLAAEPRTLLGVSRSVIALMDETGDNVNIVSQSSEIPIPPRVSRTYSAHEPESMRMVLQRGQVVTSNDIERDAGIFHIEFLRDLSIRSLMMLPLTVQDRIIGIWVVTCDRPHGFRDVEVRLARLWASQIALTLGNSHFFEQMRQALDAQKKATEQRDMLAAVNAAMFQAATVDESVAQIANLGPGALGVDMCIATLMAGPDEMVIAAANGQYAGRVIGERFSMRDGYASSVIAGRQMLVIEDVNADPNINPHFRDVLRVQSVVYVPIYRNDKSPLGMLVLVRHTPTHFDAEQRRLIQVFATRAAAALETAELHEQTRRDAETKAMLLRELNHRVKNNLAGIIGLLSIGEPDLPARARQWLDRAIERIATMARAHELFASGVEKVSMADLVAQLLPSLAVVKPVGVEVTTDLGRVDVFLRTDRAVSLAMVLHELCYNGIVHGLSDRNGGSGTLSVTAREVGQNRVRIEVANDNHEGQRLSVPVDRGIIDSGGAVAVVDPISAATTTSGLGLKLVEGLVGRELGGVFTLVRRDDGRTVAAVEFPLLPDESHEADP